MPNTQLPMLQSEWTTLQTQFDSYEKYSLVIKLFSILIYGTLTFALNAGIWSPVIVAILWLQDGIWKTFQNRIGQRLEVIEQAIQQHSQATQEQISPVAMQFNLAWGQSRPSTLGLIGEYTKQSLKPTVAYPYVVLICVAIVQFYGS